MKVDIQKRTFAASKHYCWDVLLDGKAVRTRNERPDAALAALDVLAQYALRSDNVGPTLDAELRKLRDKCHQYMRP